MSELRDLDRVFVIKQPELNAPTYLQQVYAQASLEIPVPLLTWEEEVDAWCGAYRALTAGANIVETRIDTAVFLFDLTAERVVLAYALSSAPLHKRDSGRMRRFPDVNVGVRAELGDQAFVADRGHFLGHASGGVLDINLFPHRRELNRGWSQEGKAFRAMEKYVAANPGVFFYQRPIYDDATWIPAQLEYGYLDRHLSWHRSTFANK
jgi:hypothetical protein